MFITIGFLFAGGKVNILLLSISTKLYEPFLKLLSIINWQNNKDL